MEINTQKKNEQITALKNAEIISKFSDGKFLFKIAGENVWYLVDSNGNTIPRTRPDGTEEFSTIDFYEMSGNPYYFELGQFIEGFIVAKLLSEKNGSENENYYKVSPSGYAYKTNSTLYKRFGLNYRLDEQISCRDFLRIPVWDFNSKEHLDFLFDIAQNHLLETYNRFLKSRTTRQNKQRERTFHTAAKHMAERYAFVNEYLEKRRLKQETKASQDVSSQEPEATEKQ